MSLVRIAVLLATAGLVAAAPLAGQGEKGKGGRGKPDGKEAAPGRKAGGPASDVEIRLIRDYYVGKARPKPLPPGIAKNLARGKPLPPGIAKTRMPPDLVVRLPVRAGHEWLLAGDLVVLIDPVGIVVDVLREIF